MIQCYDINTPTNIFLKKLKRIPKLFHITPVRNSFLADSQKISVYIKRYPFFPTCFRSGASK